VNGAVNGMGYLVKGILVNGAVNGSERKRVKSLKSFKVVVNGLVNENQKAPVRSPNPL
jgi:hypothetical protein